MKHIIFFAFCILFSIHQYQAYLDITCKNPDALSVDWFSQIKFPESIQKAQEFKVAYYDNTFTSTDFKQMPNQLSENGEAVYSTLNIANLHDDLTVIVWNDEPADVTLEENSSSHSAHSKGILVLDSVQDQGFLIIHSVPKFPLIKDEKFVLNDFLHNQNIYGQSQICMSLSGETINDLAEKIRIERPVIYFAKNIDTLGNQYASVKTLGNKDFDSAPHDAVLELTTIGNTHFTGFFKSGYSPSEPIFETYMIPYLQTSLLVESWGRPYEPSTCNVAGKYKSDNIKYLSFSQKATWKDTKDHSKWCISADQTKPIVCIGGMNKMTSQYKRGGDFFCQVNPNLYQAFHSKIQKIEECVEGQAKSFIQMQLENL